ncbi:altronate dehydratase family protein [Ruminococcaceae bacterium OttesenSCG-928-A16]|nr:altronate dehydratase family protein [Ruminococcaceae bacterium OttesenSCG-928-A16]
MPSVVHINKNDNVAVAVHPLAKGDAFTIEGVNYTAQQDIPQGHKIALVDIAAETPILKYGYPIGTAKQDIPAGMWVHTHNTKTALGETAEYSYNPNITPLPPQPPATFNGYLREDGRAAVRNELWILPTVGCVNDICTRLATENANLAAEFGLDGIYAFPHPYGCSQMGDDHETTREILADLARHPNAGGVLVVGLGCENNTLDGFKTELASWNDEQTKFMLCQAEEDEFVTGSNLLKQLAEYAGRFKRTPLPASKLVVGMKCGGSDGLSGITANAAVGAFSDLLVAQGGSSILTEVPEMFGAEEMLMNRCVSPEIYQKTVDMVNGFKDYFVSHGQVVYENPSPGNKDGGITTLEDKSLGCVQKGGFAPISDVIAYGETVKTPGLTLLSGPGNDLVSTTALTAAGAHIILFTTGRGTPFGAPAVTVKVASNSQLYNHKRNWIDFDAGTIVEGETVAHAGQRMLDYVLQVASGEATKAEQNNYRGIAIFKDGVTL